MYKFFQAATLAAILAVCGGAASAQNMPVITSVTFSVNADLALVPANMQAAVTADGGTWIRIQRNNDPESKFFTRRSVTTVSGGLIRFRLEFVSEEAQRVIAEGQLMCFMVGMQARLVAWLQSSNGPTEQKCWRIGGEGNTLARAVYNDGRVIYDGIGVTFVAPPPG